MLPFSVCHAGLLIIMLTLIMIRARLRMICGRTSALCEDPQGIQADHLAL